MNITLRPETQKRIEHTMQAGGYSSADDVVQAGLQLLEERDRQKQRDLAQVRQKIAAGLEQLDLGAGLDGEETFAQLLAELDSGG